MKVIGCFVRNLFVLALFNLNSLMCEKTSTIEIEKDLEISNNNNTTENGITSTCCDSEKSDSEATEPSTISNDKSLFSTALTLETSPEVTPEFHKFTTQEGIIGVNSEKYTTGNRISPVESYNNPTKKTIDQKFEVTPQNIPMQQTSFETTRGTFKSTTIDKINNTEISTEFSNANEYEGTLKNSYNLYKTPTLYENVSSTTTINSKDDIFLPLTAATGETSMKTTRRIFESTIVDSLENSTIISIPESTFLSLLEESSTPYKNIPESSTSSNDTSPVDIQKFHKLTTKDVIEEYFDINASEKGTSSEEFSYISTEITSDVKAESTSEKTTVDSSKSSTNISSTASTIFPTGLNNTSEYDSTLIMNSTHLDESSTSFERIPTSTTGPNCEVYNISYNSLDIGIWSISTTWTIETNDSFNELACNLTLVLTCEVANGNNISAVLRNTTEADSLSTSIILTGLIPFTNYSCKAELNNDDDILAIQHYFNITTLSDAPSKVDFTITDVTANNFTIEWKEPSSFSGYNKMYYIIIEDKGPQHYVRSSDFNNTVYRKGASDDKILVHGASPNTLYEIQVVAGNEQENGTSEIKQVITNSSYSTEPFNVTSDLQTFSNHCNGTTYNSTLVLKWELPLNTNGELENFQIEIIGSDYLENFSVLSNETDVTNISYHLNVPNLNASTTYNYSILPITAGNIVGKINSSSKTTPDGCPSKPTTLVINHITSSGFKINWKEPEDFYGTISKYDVEIKVLKPNHVVSTDKECNVNLKQEFTFDSNDTFSQFEEGLPDYNYQIRTRAWTSAGTSEYSDYENVTTTSTESTPVRNISVITSGHSITEEIYEYNVTLSFKKPCNTNGPFVSYSLKYSGSRDGYRDDDFTYEEVNISQTFREITLKNAEYTYSFAISVITENHYSIVTPTNTIKTIAGVPPANPAGINYEINDENPTRINSILKKNMFNNSNGNVMYYAIILMPTNGSAKPRKFHYGEWNESWPSANETVLYNGNKNDIIQLTRNYWNPFNDSINTIVFSIGDTSNCQFKYCYNLLEDTNYILVTRGLTDNTYRDIYSFIKTGKSSSNIWIITTSVFFCLFLVISAMYLYSKKGQTIRIKFKRISNANATEDVPRHVISVKNFSSYHNKIEDNPEILRQQYKDIDEETRIYKEQHVKTDFALKLENKRKNRYINILPYDQNRIKLNIDEDDEICSDYINASYVKGFSGEIEYIASQGPLEHTCKDFWKMVIQENVTVIVMVSHFFENEKEKCFKYFPKNYENLLICEDLEVKCLTELQFDSYCVRTLLVRKDIKQYSVVHLQYLDWPDFGCPSGTSNMLFFCQEVRDRIKLEKGLMVVHCSAGVGRTGTLISLDILLQAVKKKKEISIFETVLQLRKQRTHMVQTEKQYVYLHTCIKDALENEAMYLREDVDHCEDHTYKNTLYIKNHIEDDLRNTEHESVF